MRAKLNGVVVRDGELWLYEFFGEPAFSPATVQNLLDSLPEDEELVLEINSGGGSVYAGFEIYSSLLASPRRTRAEIQSIAASAASTIMLGCDEVAASPVAQVMIHLPTMDQDGDRYDHLKAVNVLDSVTESILNGYVAKCGNKASRAELRGLMRASTWLTAPEAKGLGLVDRILGEEASDPSAVLNACGGGRGIRAMAARPATDYGSLLARYQALVAEGKAPERAEALRNSSEIAPDAAETQQEAEELQAAMAALELEKIRFGGTLI